MFEKITFKNFYDLIQKEKKNTMIRKRKIVVTPRLNGKKTDLPIATHAGTIEIKDREK